jgi:thiol-disulfide isomerase/thioredoxin
MAGLLARIDQGKPTDTDAVAGGLKHRPLLVFFYMEGCSHCEVTRPHWNEMKKKYPSIRAIEVESANVSSDEHVNGFPTIKFKPAKGKERVTSGEKHSSAEIIRDLGLNRRVTRHSSRRRSRHTTRRRLRH